MASDKPRLEPPPTTLPAGSTVWVYLRDSGGPTQERSVQQQREMLIEYCEKYGLIISMPPFEDVHKSGGTTQGRNDFDYMMSLSSLADQRPNGLLVWNFARFSRGGAWDAQFYKSTLRQRGIIIHSLTDKIPEGEFAPIIESIIDISNKQKKDEAALGAWRGLRHNVKQGAIPGVAPLGMKRTPIKTISADGVERVAHRWDPDPDFSHRINKAFKMKAQRKSLAEIHAETNLFGSINSYVTFFRNSIYIGTLNFGDMIIENYCAPTVPKKIWDAVQSIMQAAIERKNLTSGKDHPRRVASIYILSSILRCARCGGAMNGQTTKQPYGDDYRQYICATAKNKKTCTAKAIPAKVLEKMILDGLHKFYDDPQNIINVISRFRYNYENRQKVVDEERASIAADLSSIRKKLNNISNVLSERPSSPTLLKKLSALEEQEHAQLTKLAQLKSQTSAPVIVPTIEQARAVAIRIQQDLRSEDPAKVRQVLIGMVEHVKADRTGKAIIADLVYYHVPTVKKKDSGVNYAYDFPPRGGTIYRHSLRLTGIIALNGRPKKKPGS